MGPWCRLNAQATHSFTYITYFCKRQWKDDFQRAPAQDGVRWRLPYTKNSAKQPSGTYLIGTYLFIQFHTGVGKKYSQGFLSAAFFQHNHNIVISWFCSNINWSHVCVIIYWWHNLSYNPIMNFTYNLIVSIIKCINYNIVYRMTIFPFFLRTVPFQIPAPDILLFRENDNVCSIFHQHA